MKVAGGGHDTVNTRGKESRTLIHTLGFLSLFLASSQEGGVTLLLSVKSNSEEREREREWEGERERKGSVE